MTMNLLKNILKEHSIIAKFMVLQMVLLLAKMQALGTKILLWADILPCKPPITPTVYGNCKLLNGFKKNFTLEKS